MEQLTDDRLYESGIKQNNFTHVAVRDNEGRVVVISSEKNIADDIISNFSFLFLIQVFTGLLFVLFFALYFTYKNVRLNYSARIQLYLNIAFFLPLFAVSITTLSLINSSFRSEVNEEYYRKAQNIAGNISDDLVNFLGKLTLDQDELSRTLTDIAKFSGVDVNLFNVSGKLIATRNHVSLAGPIVPSTHSISHYITFGQRC